MDSGDVILSHFVTMHQAPDASCGILYTLILSLVLFIPVTKQRYCRYFNGTIQRVSACVKLIFFNNLSL